MLFAPLQLTDWQHCLHNDLLFVEWNAESYSLTYLFNLVFTDDKFQQLQQTFLEKHYEVFEDAEENKLIYTDIHEEYVII